MHTLSIRHYAVSVSAAFITAMLFISAAVAPGTLA